MKKKQIILTVVFIVLFVLGLTLATLLSLFILDALNGPFILLIFNIVLLTGVVVARIVLYKHKIYFRIIPWGGYLVFFILLTFFAHPSYGVKSVAYYPNPVQTPVLSLNDGDIVGLYNKDQSVMIYGNIPFAKPPVAELRFKEPVPNDSWEGVRDCTHFASRAMQETENEFMNTLVDMYAEKGWHPNYETKYLEPMSEDCLYLNVWKPTEPKEGGYPVVMYFHGGALARGKPWLEDYNGETFAKNGVIFVSSAYRLGVFGYMAHPLLKEESPNHTTGNYGLLDQIAALKWVYKNISSFGGNPNMITIAGESAGSSSVSAMCISPLVDDAWIKYAIGESSSIIMNHVPHTFRTLEQAYEQGQKVMDEFNCKTLEDLRNVPAEKLVNSSTDQGEMTADGYAISDQLSAVQIYEQGLNHEDALLNGYNVLEADAFYVPQRLFSPTNKGNIKTRITEEFNEEYADKIYKIMEEKINKDAFSAMNEIMSVKWFIGPHDYWSKYALMNEPVYRYQFTKENGYYGTYHSGELPYAYGNLHMSDKQFAYNKSDYDLSDIMVKYWTNFIKTGNPNSEGVPEWELYNPNNAKPIMELGSNVGMFEDRYVELYKVMDDYYKSLDA